MAELPLPAGWRLRMDGSTRMAAGGTIVFGGSPSSGPAAALLEQRGVLEASYLGDVPMAPREYPDP